MKRREENITWDEHRLDQFLVNPLPTFTLRKCLSMSRTLQIASTSSITTRWFGVAALPSFKGGFVDLAGIASSSFH